MPYPRLISARDRGIKSNSSCGRGSGRRCDSKGRGSSSSRGRGPHARSIGGVVPTVGLHHCWLGEGWRIWKGVFLQGYVLLGGGFERNGLK